MLLDSNMEEIINHVLLKYYAENIKSCSAIIEKLEEENPMEFPRAGFYKYKFKKLLCSVALGMMPSEEWDGKDDATGGYVIVKEDGECLAYHLYNRDAFEEYLLANTNMEKGSSSRHEFMTIYEEDGEFRVNLNLQIRFK